MTPVSIVAFLLVFSFSGKEDVPGLYQMDKDLFLKTQFALLKAQVPKEELEKLESLLKAEVAEITITAEFKKNGAIYFSSKINANDIRTGKGTWKLEGDQLTLILTHRDGVPIDRGNMVKATFAEKKIVWQMEPGQPEIVLVKKAADLKPSTMEKKP